jgi:hypothetical protein
MPIDAADRPFIWTVRDPGVPRGVSFEEQPTRADIKMTLRDR